MDLTEQIFDLLHRAEQLQHDAGDSSIQLAEEAVRLAGVHGDKGISYQAHTQLLDSATYGGQPEKALVAFAWCRAEYARRPDDYELWSLLWRQKWIVTDLPNFDAMPLARIRAAEDEMEQAFRRWGGGEKAVLGARLTNALAMGDLRRVESLFGKWLIARPDMLTDCAACTRSTEVSVRIALGDLETALLRVEPYLAKWDSCVGSNIEMRCNALEPMFILGHWERARSLQRSVYPRSARSRKHLDGIGKQLRFLSLSEELATGLDVFERHVGWALDRFNPSFSREFWVGAAGLFTAVAAQGQKTVSLQLPKGVPFSSSADTYATEQLQAWTTGLAREAVEKFDARNGNHHHAHGLNALLAATAIAPAAAVKRAARRVVRAAQPR